MRRAVVASVFLLSGTAHAADSVTAGTVSAPYPTLENVSIDWAVSDDDNANAVASVRYRKQGESAFRGALPLVRVPAGENEGFTWTSKLSGSIFGLEPGTTYEVELTLGDPDGGDEIASVTVTTRAVPAIPADAREVAVTPATIADALDAAEPNDVLVLADGTYAEIVVPNDGEAGRPIALRPESPSGAVVEGDVRMDGRSFVHVEGLTVHGKFKFNDAESIVVRGCTIVTPDDGIVSFGTGVRNAVITDNVITGPTIWQESSLGVDGDNLGEGIQLTGPGNVVAYNRVTGFRDCLSLLEDSEAVEQVSNDFYGNDLSECADDAVEADFAMGNVRVYGNRVTKSFMGLSSQPGLGGPTYFVRNVLYGVLYQAFKLQRSSVGDVGYHNTIVKSGDAFSVNTSDIFSRALFRNNLFIGGPGGVYLGYDSGPGNVTDLPSADASCSFDYDGYGSIGTGAFEGRIGDVRFSSLDELRSMTTEAHAVEVDLSVFQAAVVFPSDPFDVPAPPSFALASGSAAVDRGTPLANVSDGFAGAAPDLGALELGGREPPYGPGAGAQGGGGSGGTTATGGTGASSSGGGAGGSAGASATGGSAAGGASSGGATNGGATNAGSGGDAGTPSDAASNDDEGGCGCRVVPRSNGSVTALSLLALAAFAVVRSRRSRAR
jgi:MYXO-CTERM domain-containing protein